MASIELRFKTYFLDLISLKIKIWLKKFLISNKNWKLEIWLFKILEINLYKEQKWIQTF